MRPSKPGALLVIVPAYNEEGAIAEVVDLRAHPRSGRAGAGDRRLFAGFHARRGAAGRRRNARPAPSPRSGRSGAGRATSWPIELGFEYVIRVDGDGQHDARDIPRILDRLKQLRLRDGDRVALRRGKPELADRGGAVAGHPLLPHGAAAHSGPAGARSDLRIRGRQPPRPGPVQPQFPARVPRDRGPGRAAAQAVPLRGSALPHAAAPGRPVLHHRAEIAVLHRPRAAGGVRQRAAIRGPAPRSCRPRRRRTDGPPLERHHRFERAAARHRAGCACAARTSARSTRSPG